MQLLDSLGPTPHLTAVDEWFDSSGFTKQTVGRTLRNRPIESYSLRLSSHKRRTHGTSTFVFLSLLHGHEPLSLVNLLYAANAFLSEEVVTRIERAAHGKEVHLMFIPAVNRDAYELNLNAANALADVGLEGSSTGRCRRTNLRRLCTDVIKDATGPCHTVSNDGVDLSRNFDFDFMTQAGLDAKDRVSSSKGKECSPNFHGYEPFSEPETQAVRDVFVEHQPLAAVTYHTTTDDTEGGGAALLRPFTSDVAHDMRPDDVAAFDRLGKAMMKPPPLRVSPDGYGHGDVGGGSKGGWLGGRTRWSTKPVYRNPTIGPSSIVSGYTRRGSPIDWMYDEIGTLALVHSGTTPCEKRWCDDSDNDVYGPAIRDLARSYASSAVALVEESLFIEDRAEGGKGGPWRVHHYFSVAAIVLFLLIVAMAFALDAYGDPRRRRRRRSGRFRSSPLASLLGLSRRDERRKKTAAVELRPMMGLGGHDEEDEE